LCFILTRDLGRPEFGDPTKYTQIDFIIRSPLIARRLSKKTKPGMAHATGCDPDDYQWLRIFSILMKCLKRQEKESNDPRQ